VGQSGAQRDPEAFRRLYRHYVPKVYAYVAHRVSTRQDAEDIVSETFLRAARDLYRFERRHEASFSAWLFRIARNLVTDFHRRTGRADPLESAEQVLGAGGIQSEPDQLVFQNEELTSVHELIHRLSPRQQEVITLGFFGGLRNQEIAALLGVDERTVATHLCRGLEELHRQRCLDRAKSRERGEG
jgi:RNA polymerase sigma-70 factor (ECF subfamily)